MPKAVARHILVRTRAQCLEIKAAIDSGVSFESQAIAFSKCPTGKFGGGLGRFSKGEMMAEFDEAVFSGEIGKLIGPVKTQLGYHLIEIGSRS